MSIHPSARKAYAPYFPTRKAIDCDEDEAISGSPSTIVNDAAREKLSTVIIDITVEAKHRLNALRTKDSGACSVLVFDGINVANIGIQAKTANTRGENA